MEEDEEATATVSDTRHTSKKKRGERTSVPMSSGLFMSAHAV